MRSLILFLPAMFCMPLLSAQFTCETIENESDWFEAYKDFKTNEGDEGCTSKAIRLNIHFFLKEDGTGNFTETGDGFGNDFTGYDVASDLIEKLNFQNSYHESLNIPPNNSIPNLNKNYSFILNGVYFHRTNDVHFSPIGTGPGSGGASHHVFAEDEQEVINVYYSWDFQNDLGYASTTNPTATNIYTVMNTYRRYSQYMNAPPGTDNIDWWYHALVHGASHELGHLLGLSHTVSNTGPNSNDGCDDTPIRQWMLDNFGVNPDCGWATGYQYGCSNNMMDYNGSYSLSPCQLERVHTGLALENGTKRFIACNSNKLQDSQHFCNFSYPVVSYFGSDILIDDCNTGNGNIVESETNIIFNKEVVINNIEVVHNNSGEGAHNITFEITKECICD